MIVNNPFYKIANNNTYAWQDNIFSDDELKLIIELCESEQLIRGKVQGGEEKKIRDSMINFHERNIKTDWIFDRLNTLVEQINGNFFNFDLVGYDAFQYSTYNSDTRGRYGWHIDSHNGALPINNWGLQRKLSMTLLLNDDFKGGAFEINQGRPEKIPMRRGRAVFFPSYLLHQVKPVTAGTRKSLVIWVLGPKLK